MSHSSKLGCVELAVHALGKITETHMWDADANNNKRWTWLPSYAVATELSLLARIKKSNALDCREEYAMQLLEATASLLPLLPSNSIVNQRTAL